jgi:hypothetical protein
MLTAFEKPDHVFYPRGIMCVDCQEFAPAELERCIACGSSAVALVEEGWDDAGKPHPGHPHHVELDVSTGMVGYTRLTKTEITERAAEAKRIAVAEQEIQKELEQRHALIREKASSDPAFAALAKHLGINLEP